MYWCLIPAEDLAGSLWLFPDELTQRHSVGPGKLDEDPDGRLPLGSFQA